MKIGDGYGPSFIEKKTIMPVAWNMPPNKNSLKQI